MCERSRRRRSGFTLLEVVVASAIIAGVLAVIGVSFGPVVAAWRRGVTSAERRLAMTAVVERLTTELQEAVQLAGVEASFVGERDAIDWIVRDDDTGLARLQYRYDATRRSLDRCRQAIDDGVPVGEPDWRGAWRPLIGCAFTFPYEGEGDDGPAWDAEWRGTDRLPAAVRIAVAWEEAGATQTLERIIVLPHGVIGAQEVVSRE